MLRVFNTLKKEKQEFRPLKEKEVFMYVCGPTVYDIGHLGHARSAVAFDIVRRYLIYKGYRVRFASNYTDIDDKMIKRANKEGVTVKQLAEKIIPEYEKDYEQLEIMKPDICPKATGHIKEIIGLIKRLEEKGFIYVIEDDGVYYDVTKFKEYGKLSHQNIEELKAGARVEKSELKKHPQDFVLWKFKKQNEPSWSSPWGEGRPGWHIECSAMIIKQLGETIDIHGGGQDLIFPHHEDEIAQSEAATGKPFARYWLHNGFVKVDEEKMSKSLGNFFTIKDILKQYGPKVVRYFLFSTHYRSPINFADTLLNQAKKALERLWEFMDKLDEYSKNPGSEKNNPAVDSLIEKTRIRFKEAMDDDFETSRALGAVFDLLREVNRLMMEKEISKENCNSVKSLMKEFDSVFNVLEKEKQDIPKEIIKMAEERQNAREQKEWAKSDALRNKIKDKGFIIEDAPEGFKIKRI